MKLAITVRHAFAHRDEVERPKTAQTKRRHGRLHALWRGRARH
jgi:hypothetical protein